MTPLIRYGKKNVLGLKQSFFAQNRDLLANQLRINAIYAAQPLRRNCKLCDGPLSDTGGFTKHGVDYVQCPVCQHLNGRHEETDAFCAAVYGDDGGASYARNYTSADVDAYRRRVDEIYVPKARFLLEALAAQGFAAGQGFADFGAGSGYFVSALQACGVGKITGYEVSEAQVSLARQMNPGATMVQHGLEKTISLARETQADVVSMIGVLEHLGDPRGVLAALRSNPHVRYFYISVPLFSSSVVIEALFPEVMPRQLSGAHTHLFTEGSLRHMEKEFGFQSVAEWWFGTDMTDLFRSFVVQLAGTERARELEPFAAGQLLSVIDELQLALDQRRLSSEVHMLFKVRN